MAARLRRGWCNVFLNHHCWGTPHSSAPYVIDRVWPSNTTVAGPKRARQSQETRIMMQWEGKSDSNIITLYGNEGKNSDTKGKNLYRKQIQSMISSQMKVQKHFKHRSRGSVRCWVNSPQVLSFGIKCPGHREKRHHARSTASLLLSLLTLHWFANI